jgi:hypothetical protein
MEQQPCSSRNQKVRDRQRRRASSVIFSLTSAANVCQHATSSRRPKSVQAVCRQGGGVSAQVPCSETTCGFREAGAIPAASTFSVHASPDDIERQDASKLHDDDRVPSHEDRPDFRQEATVNGGSRPGRATESATGTLFNDPNLAVVVAAWPEFPEAVRAGILAMATGLEHIVDDYRTKCYAPEGPFRLMLDQISRFELAA